MMSRLMLNIQEKVWRQRCYSIGAVSDVRFATVAAGDSQEETGTQGTE